MNPIEILRHAIDLIEKNPGLPVRVLAAFDEMSPDHGWTAVELTRAEVIDWFEDGDTIYDDECQIKEIIADNLCDDNTHLTDEEFEKLVEETYKKDVRQVIAVWTQPGGIVK